MLIRECRLRHESPSAHSTKVHPSRVDSLCARFGATLPTLGHGFIITSSANPDEGVFRVSRRTGMHWKGVSGCGGTEQTRSRRSVCATPDRCADLEANWADTSVEDDAKLTLGGGLGAWVLWVDVRRKRVVGDNCVPMLPLHVSERLPSVRFTRAAGRATHQIQMR